MAAERHPREHEKGRYAAPVSTSSLSGEEIRAAAGPHREHGPGYGEAAADSFLERVDREIGALVDARLATALAPDGTPAPEPDGDRRRGLLTWLMAGGVIAGIPLAWLAFALEGRAARPGFAAWLIGISLVIMLATWAAVAVMLKPRARPGG